MTRSLPRPRRTRRCRLERLEDRALLCGDGNLAGALEIGPSDIVVEKLADQQESSVFRVEIPEPGRLTIQTRSERGSVLETRTSLLDAKGRVLIHSDARSTTDGDDLIEQHLLTGAYFVKVEGLAGAGDFALTTQFEPATAPTESLAVNFDRDYPFAESPPYHVAGDFNGDGHLDIATPNTWTSDVSILLGQGDGSFQSARNFAVGAGPFGIAAADFNGDGRVDLATVNQNSNDVSVLLATGDESLFAPLALLRATGQSARLSGGRRSRQGAIGNASAGARHKRYDAAAGLACQLWLTLVSQGARFAATPW